MISDSAYPIKDLAISPRIGALAGLIAGFLMLLATEMMTPFSAFSCRDLLSEVEKLVIGNWILSGSSQFAYGLIIHFALTALFGILYSLCQESIPSKGLFAVGLFYGFILWVGVYLIARPFLPESLRNLLSTWTWMLASIVYGVTLAAFAFLWLKLPRQNQLPISQPD